MKILLTSLFVLIQFTLVAQWNYDSQSLIYSSNGNVGIGTSTPTFRFHIKGANANSDAMSLGTSTTGNFALTSADGGAYGLFGGVSNTGRAWLQAGRFDSILPYDLLLQGSGGNVGIGMLAPAFKLDVEGFGARVKNSSTASAAYTTWRLQGPDYTNGLEIDFFGNNNIISDPNWSYGGGAGSVAIVNVNSKPLTFGTANVGRMLIDASGNIGIGTFTPYSHSRLHVKAPTSSPWAITAEANANDKVIGVSHDGTNGIVAVSSFGSGFSPLQLWTSNTPRVTIAVDGAVGIGTTPATDAKLAVNGQLKIIDASSPWNIGFGMNGDPARHVSADVVNSAVDTDPLELVYNRGTGVIIGNSSATTKFLKVYGTAYAREVNVTLSIPGPDYVFQKNYDLLSLTQLETYINQNKHLPEVPSAKEMEKDGLNLKEMNLILLKKVEELTLHLIEQSKRTESLQQDNATLLKSKTETELRLKALEMKIKD
jgi:hypothetical protein